MSTGQQTDQNTHQSHNQNKEKLDQIDSLIASFPDGQVPESSLGNALNNMATQWNSLLTQVITEVDHTQQPIPLDHIKETAEFTVKEFKEACLKMNSELTRLSMHWQLKNPKEMLEQKTTDYENSIERQKKLLERIKQKIDNEANPMALGTQDLLRNFH